MRERREKQYNTIFHMLLFNCIMLIYCNHVGTFAADSFRLVLGCFCDLVKERLNMNLLLNTCACFFRIRFRFSSKRRHVNVKLRKCHEKPDIEVQRGVYVLIGVNELGTQSRVSVYIIYD